jgi:hypothetical protein
MEHEGLLGLYKQDYLEVAKISLAYCSQFWRIWDNPGQHDSPMVPTSKTLHGYGFLKVFAKFQT